MSLKQKIESLGARNKSIADEIAALGSVEAEGEAQDVALNTIKELGDEFDANEKQLDVLNNAYDQTQIASVRAVAQRVPAEVIVGDAQNQQVDAKPGWERIAIPAKAAFCKSRFFDNDREAYFSGLFLCASAGNDLAKAKLSESGYSLKGARNDMATAPGNAGGFAVPEPMAATIIRLVEEAGVARRSLQNIPMTSSTLDVPKRDGGLTVYYPGEGQNITNSDITFGQVNLVAKKYAVLALMSTELEEDAIISMVDLVVEEIAYAIAVAEDTNSFLGDGTAAFNGITGIANALNAGAQLNLNANWGAQTLDEFTDAVAALPLYSGMRPAWYVNHSGFAASMQRLMYTTGGNTTDNVAAGTPAQFLGFPVYFTQVLPGLNAVAGDLTVVLGDLRLGGYMGIRRSLTIKVLNELYAASDQVGIVATSRSDTQIFDVGDATNAGCIVGLYAQ